MAAQIFPIATNFLDRLLLTGIALRALGIAQFEYWSVALSLVSLLTIFDFGCMMNFSNMVTHARQRGENDRSADLYAQSNAIFLIIALLALAVGWTIAASHHLQAFLGFHTNADVQHTTAVLFLLASASGARLAMTNAMAAYRASLAFGRGTIVSAAGELCRILATIAGVLLSYNLLGAAIGHLAGTLLGILLLQVDIARRTPMYRYRLRSPLSADMRGAWRTSLAFAAPLLPQVAMLQFPVLFLSGRAQAGAGIIAIFVLTRTISNILRTLLWQATNVLGMEGARLLVQGRSVVAGRLIDLLSWLMAVGLGSIAGILLGAGAEFVRLWTGSGHLFDVTTLAIMLSPLVLAPTYLLASALLQASNKPKVWSLGTYGQVAVAAVLYVALAPLPILWRVSASIYLGEVIALAFPVAMTAWGKLSPASLFTELTRTAVSLAAAALGYALVTVIGSLWSAPGLVPFVVSAAVAALPGGVLILYLTWRIAAVDRSQS